MPVLTLVDGELCNHIPGSDRGLSYGHGIFETVRVHSGRSPLWERHLARLQMGAARLHIPLDSITPHLADWRDRILQLASDADQQLDGILKLVVTAGRGERGYSLPTQAAPLVILSWHPSTAALPLAPARLRVCRLRLAHQPELAGIKHLNRLEQVLARAEWQGDTWDEGIMLDQAERLVECTSSNLFLHHNGRWYTPALELAGVTGVMRNLLLDTVIPACGQQCHVDGGLTLEDLRGADEVFISNAVMGIRPVLRIEAVADWSAWPASNRLRQYLSDHYEYPALC